MVVKDAEERRRTIASENEPLRSVGDAGFQGAPGGPAPRSRFRRRSFPGFTKDGRPERLGLGRRFWVVVHRWAGLTIALFLIVLGATGALLPWSDELRLASRPSLSRAAPPRPGARVLDGISLAERVERSTGGAIRSVDLDVAADHVASLRVRSRSSRPLPFDTVWADPYTGAVRLEYNDGDLRDGPQTIVPFVNDLHRQLALGRFGQLTLGVAALVWTVDCFVGFYLTLPIRRRPLPGAARPAAGWFARWRPAWSVRWRRGSYKLTFDLHRAGGLWLWPMLLVFAWSGVSLNLSEVSTPVMRSLGASAPTELRALSAPLSAPPIGRREAQARGSALLSEIARRDGFVVIKPVGLSYDPAQAAYRYNARSSLDVVDAGGATSVSFSAVDGRMLQFSPPVDRNRTDAFMTWLTMLHFAEVLGLPYRIFVTSLGLMVVTLSLTGVLVWMKKRTAQLLRVAR